jgi:putative phage-type endonuclease
MKFEIVISTTNIDRNDWLNYRRAGIGGSDVSAILGVNKYKSAFSLWADKTGQAKPDQGNKATQWGNDLEMVVAQNYAREYNAQVAAWPQLLRSKENPFMLANLDFLICEGDVFPNGEVTVLGPTDPFPGDVLRILEIKTTGIVGRGSGHLWNNGGVPQAYELQGHHYSLVTGIDRVTFACLVPGEGLVVREREYTNATANAQIIDDERAFWNLVETKTPPDATGGQSTLEAVHHMFPVQTPGKTVEADDQLLELIAEYRRVKALVEGSEAVLKDIRAQLEYLIGDGETVEWAGQELLTLKATKGRESLDTKAFKATCPDIYQNFVRVSQGARVLRLKGE